MHWSLAKRDAEINPNDAFAWFNVGTNLVYFESYTQAAGAYDNARDVGLPQRMLRYQFGPFFAYFHTGRIDDLLSLTEYALERTPNSEEAKLWRGWAMYRQGKKEEEINLFDEALAAPPYYFDATYALDFCKEQVINKSEYESTYGPFASRIYEQSIPNGSWFPYLAC